MNNELTIFITQFFFFVSNFKLPRTPTEIPCKHKIISQAKHHQLMFRNKV